MRNARILYIDDELDLLEIALSFFEEENIQLETASEYSEAIKLLKDNHYDVVITDAHMPTGSGLDIISFLRNEKKFSGKIILATGSMTPSSDECSFDQIIYKPINFAELIEHVKSALKL